MARLRKIKGRYFAYFYDRHRTPREKSFPLRVSLKSAAEKKLRELIRARDESRFDPWSPNPFGGAYRLTYEVAGQAFLGEKAHLRPKTQEAYSLALRGLGALLPTGILLCDVSAKPVRAYVEAAGVTASTQRHRYRHLAVFFRWAVEAGHLDGVDGKTANPMDSVRLPKEQKKVAAFLTPEGLERLLAAVDADFAMKRAEGLARDGQCKWIKDVVLVAVGTGLRLGEVCALRWGAVDLEHRMLTVRSGDDFVTKSGHERAVPLAGDALAVLERLAAQRDASGEGDRRDFVLVMPSGKPLRPNYVSRRFKHYARLAKLPESIRFHSLRHTTASWLTMRGVPLPVTQRILGHSSITVTERYAHLAPEVMHEAMRSTFE
ncbi:MAG: site-specific integrase [Bacteroidota bacterium]